MANQTALKNQERLRKVARDAIAADQGGAFTKGPEDQRKKQTAGRDKDKEKKQALAAKTRKSPPGKATDQRRTEKAPLEGIAGYSDPHVNR